MSTTTQQMTSESGLTGHSMARTILRIEDATRIPFSLRPDDHEKPRASSADTRPRNDIVMKASHPPANDTSNPEDGLTAKPDLLSPDEALELFRKKVADAQQDTQNALAGGEDVSEAVRPKLTLDLGHSRIARLPESVVDLIKVEVERLSLSHNQMWYVPLRLPECSQLRYLNIRTNVFRDIPLVVRMSLGHRINLTNHMS